MAAIEVEPEPAAPLMPPEALPPAAEKPLDGGGAPAGRSAAPPEAPVLLPEVAEPVLADVFKRA